MSERSSIPKDEREELLDAVGDAAVLAGRGKISDGQQVLEAVVDHAETAQDLGEPWADELEDLSRAALENFENTYEV